MSISLLFYECLIWRSYESEFYYRETPLATYNCCVQPVGTHLDWRVEDDAVKTLTPIFKRQAGKSRKQKIPSVREFISSSRCSNCNCKRHNSRTCKQRLNN